MEYYFYKSTPLGTVLLRGDDTALTGLWFTDQRYFPSAPPDPTHAGGVIPAVCGWLDGYFAGSAPGALQPLSPPGTGFRQAVWRELLEIPRGSTATYGEISERLCVRGISSSPRAVGCAAGHNPISIVIPCHRVIGAGGKLTGYAGGLWRKRRLLALEGVSINPSHA